MAEICELLPSQKGSVKTNVHGYLMVKDKNRGELFYWCCEKRKTESCKERATTKKCAENHILQHCFDHNHAPQVSAAPVAKAVSEMKKSAIQTKDLPCQIIQTVTSTINPENQPYMPTKNALRKKIGYERRAERPPEPQTLEELNIPNDLRHTLNQELFLIKDSVVGEEIVLIFTTQSNVSRLSRASYWIMDGTFKTVPNIFYQLYTLHAPVGNENSRVLPLVYVLMTNKREESYRRLFEDLVDYGEEHEIVLRPQVIITDLELSAIIAAKHVFPDVRNKVCFFHLGQCIWRKIQAIGLAPRHGIDEQFSLLLRHITALAFIPAGDIPDVFDALKPHLPEEVGDLVEWFENNYVHGRIRRIMRDGAV